MLEDEATETVQTDDSSDTQDTVDWQKRFTDTQAEYTRQQQILKDREAWLAHGQENFPDVFVEDEPEETVDTDDSSEYEDEPEYMTKAEFKAHQEEQKAEQAAKDAQAQFNSDLNEIVGDRELDKYGTAAILSGTYKNRDELEAAVNEWFEYTEPLHTPKRRRKPTAAVPGGKAATGVPDYSDMTRDQIDQAMVERARALESQT